MKTITANRLTRVEAPEEYKSKGVVAFQMVEFNVTFYGSDVECMVDTMILECGKQVVLGGDGLIQDGFVVPADM